ncbi:hypothetical protein B9G98_01550 [Wickerhamiella sorbophila]|uniref:Uncharacterized protein n=1 Tax=Wickerhamiella sorbophila TaxID=45607 RepID=A0A2T0FG27_9ASCO|nr:hypothetical protein B9G98_01550 [Wickerhamiella sorbophila]PRT53930.1 hypothetical protein B9G98_01550 [Wickerhamiella sorbophila]
MGGHGAIKGEAWSPSGGWFFTPKNWKPNTMVVLGGLAAVGLATYVVGNKLQYVANQQEPDSTIERWNLAARKGRQQSATTAASN